jgi:predicted  nucleic acid-binding Zn-ribbon protein
MFCKKCGKEVQEGVRFCPSCGAELSSVSSEVENGTQEVNNIDLDTSGSTQQTNRADSEAGSSASKESIKTGIDKKISINAIKTSLKKHFIQYIVTLIVFAIIIYIAKGDSSVNTVKNSSFVAYPDKTIGKAFDDFFTNTKWDSYKKGGKTYVKFTGKYTTGKSSKKAQIIFKFSDDDNFQVESMTMDGDTYTSSLDVWYYLDMIYDE